MRIPSSRVGRGAGQMTLNACPGRGTSQLESQDSICTWHQGWVRKIQLGGNNNENNTEP